MVIPEPWADSRVFYERLTNPTVVARSVWSQPLTFLVEPVSRRCIHACTIDDVVRILEHIPKAHLADINTIVFRQPTRKQNILKPCWGRLVYWASLGPHSGPTVILEAQDPTQTNQWSVSLDPNDKAELERLREDGHHITQTRRNHIVESSVESIRATQLYRTIPHEIGHYVHYLQTPNAEYESKSSSEKESFAHRYADELRQSFTQENKIPFERITGSLCAGSDGLPKSWFGLT